MTIIPELERLRELAERRTAPDVGDAIRNQRHLTDACVNFLGSPTRITALIEAVTAIERTARNMKSAHEHWDKYPHLRHTIIGSIVAARHIAESALANLNATIQQ